TVRRRGSSDGGFHLYGSKDVELRIDYWLGRGSLRGDRRREPDRSVGDEEIGLPALDGVDDLLNGPKSPVKIDLGSDISDLSVVLGLQSLNGTYPCARGFGHRLKTRLESGIGHAFVRAGKKLAKIALRINLAGQCLNV